MEKTLHVINQMLSEGLFARYAIGGGIAALFYLEPIATFDLDIFIILPEESAPLVSLSPLYEWLKGKGYRLQKEQVIIEGIPVQFIPVYNELVKEGVLHAVERIYGSTRTFVLCPEYLIAIMLQASRPKDIERLLRFFEEAEVSDEKLDSVLSQHNLKETYNNFRKKYYGK
jgi:hypothetical protein